MRKFLIAVCAILTMATGVGLAQELTTTLALLPNPNLPRADRRTELEFVLV